MEEMKMLNKDCIYYYLIGSEAMVNLKYVKSIIVEPLGGKTCITAMFAKDKIILDKGPKAYIEEKYKEYCKQIIMMQTQIVVLKEEK